MKITVADREIIALLTNSGAVQARNGSPAELDIFDNGILAGNDPDCLALRILTTCIDVGASPADTANGQTVSGQTTAPLTPRTVIPRPAPPRLPVDTPAAAAAQASHPKGWVVSFAAFVSEPPARDRAATISVEGQKARVVTGESNGTTIYRVILGPYPTKADAERIGRASRVSFWVYEGNP